MRDMGVMRTDELKTDSMQDKVPPRDPEDANRYLAGYGQAQGQLAGTGARMPPDFMYQPSPQSRQPNLAGSNMMGSLGAGIRDAAGDGQGHGDQQAMPTF